MTRIVAVSILSIAAIYAAAKPSSTSTTAFENEYLKMTVLPGWEVKVAPPKLTATHGKYVLTINPIYEHASGVQGGRFEEATDEMPSVAAVRANVEGPGGTTCAETRPGQEMIVNAKISLGNLYTDDTKANITDGCKFPSDGKPAWFGALYVGEGGESEYTITLAYSTSDVNELPKKGNPELTRVLNDAKSMLATLELKPPVMISGIVPKAARPGETIRVTGSGFNLPNNGVEPTLAKLSTPGMTRPKVAPDGKSLTFVIPASISVVACPPGRIEKDGLCEVEPPDHDEANDCPRRNDGSANFCGLPFPPGTYELRMSGSMVQSNPVTLTVLPPSPESVSISMLYPNRSISPGDTITIRGSGFASTDNTVKIGSTVVPSIPSSDGKTLTFPAPAPSKADLVTMGAYLKASVQASVENAKGSSNPIGFDYWYPGPNALRWQKGGIRVRSVTPQSPPKH